MTILEMIAHKLCSGLYRQYEENPRWDDAKDVIEDFDADALARTVVEAIIKPSADMIAALGLFGVDPDNAAYACQALMRAILNETPETQNRPPANEGATGQRR